MALAWWFVPCLPFPGLPHIYFLFTVRHRIFHVCRNENFRNSYLSFYWKKWFYIWYMALAWWLVPCLPFPGLPHIYFLFTVRLTNEQVGVFLARRSVQHLVKAKKKYMCVYCHMSKKSRVGRPGLFIFFFLLLSTKPEIVVPGSGIRFRYLIFENSVKMTNYAVFLPSLLSISTKS